MTGQPEINNNCGTFRPSGYYYQGVWRALGGTTVRQFKTSSAISQCLKGKMVHLYGDSTARQWFQYLTNALPDLKEFNLYRNNKFGPLMALDLANDIMMTFNCHGPPIISAITVPIAELHYIANELDGLTGGTNTVVVVSIGAHFCPFPIEMYIRRLQDIRRAVVRLLDRAPGTLVIIRTVNLRALNLDIALFLSDWYLLQFDKVLRAMFKGLSVHLVHAWEMSLAHHVPHDIHPLPPVVTNMINVLLSYICPQKSG
uniref:NXPE family member 3-like n=1 Tax=Monopterus albus TaxID=43700 RepID=UPI0009B48C91|nr:NXPE family member 3-like [Monopterus albus]